ncbi:MAG: outer membrane lipoprotein-sorting protein [Saprospiraceae bacterium]
MKKPSKHPYKEVLLSLLFMVSIPFFSYSQDAKTIIQRAEDKMRGTNSQSELKMTIVRPEWSRSDNEMAWTLVRLFLDPHHRGLARDKGAAFLKRNQEIWNWQPSIDRTIKMPPSMMMQRWMGSDLTNDDLVRESSILLDYNHRLLGEEKQEGRMCWKIELKPKPDAAVVWGRILIWIDQATYMQLRTEFYDEDDYLTNTMVGKQVKEMDGKPYRPS